jgi:hypothetical protein
MSLLSGEWKTMAKRKIHAVTVTVYVEQEGRPALPTRSEIADGLIRHLESGDGHVVPVLYGKDGLAQDMTVLTAVSNVASNSIDRIKPDLEDLRNNT